MLANYLESQFSWLQNIDFFARLLLACLCGACIGFERSKRLKEAGVRTHIIVCCAAALMMIVSKYGFVDLTAQDGTVLNGTRGADPARIAAQVISGISFLGAGVIFKNGNTVKGLTTAAGIWATAGIGLSIGAGMYVLGVFVTAVVALLQIVMHKFVIGADSLLLFRLRFTLQGGQDFSGQLESFLAQNRAQVVESTITYGEADEVSYEMLIRAPRDITIHEWHQFLTASGALRRISYQSVG